MEELIKSYRSGIYSLVLTAVFLVLQSLTFLFANNYVLMSLNIVSVLVLVFVVGLYFKHMQGYIYIGEKYSKLLKRSIYALLIVIVSYILISLLFVFSRIEQNRIIAIVLSVIFLIIYILYAVTRIIFGISLKDVPVESNTKKNLRVFEILEGASLISIIGLFVYPYFALMSFIFQTLFLKDTYEKDHENKLKRNRWFWISILIVYILLFGSFGYFFRGSYISFLLAIY